MTVTWIDGTIEQRSQVTPDRPADFDGGVIVGKCMFKYIFPLDKHSP